MLASVFPGPKFCDGHCDSSQVFRKCGVRYLSNHGVDMQLWLSGRRAVNIPAEGRSRYGP